MPPKSPPCARHDLVALWKERVDRSRERLRLATATKRAMSVYWGATMTPDGARAIRTALADEQAARAEFIEALRVFSGLVVHGKVPDEGD